MEYKEVKEALEKFGEAVVESAKTNLKHLQREKSNFYNSLKTDLTVEQNAFIRFFNGGLWHVPGCRCLGCKAKFSNKL